MEEHKINKVINKAKHSRYIMKALLVSFSLLMTINIHASNNKGYEIVSASEVVQEMARKYGKTYSEFKEERKQEERISLIINVSSIILGCLAFILIIRVIYKKSQLGVNIVKEQLHSKYSEHEIQKAQNELLKIKELFDKDILTQEEFDKKKYELKKKII